MFKICSSLKDVDGQVEERGLDVENHWLAVRLQLGFLNDIESVLSDDLYRSIDRRVLQLTQKLSQADTALRNIGKSKAKKISWALKKDALDTLISDFDRWQDRFRPLWFMVVTLASPLVDSAFAKALLTNEHGRIVRRSSGVKNPLDVEAGIRRVLSPGVGQPQFAFLPPPRSQMKTSGILFSRVKIARHESDKKWYIIDTIEVGASDEHEVRKNVTTLAAKLAKADSITFGLLNCKGAQRIQGQSARSSASSQPASSSSGRQDVSFQLWFRLPKEMLGLQSLRKLLLSSDEHISLSRKMRIARELAKAIHYVHIFAFVHKNVRPESILCFEDSAALRSHAFLVGFDAFRSASGGTMMSGDISWGRNVYRHPSRQGFDPKAKYRMKHDIYSLGVCLLEIGLWESFVEYSTEEGDSGRPRTKFGRTYYHFKQWLRERETAAGKVSPITTFYETALSLKDYLVEQANTRLAPRMGDRYAQVVLSCLTCLDEGNEDFGGSGCETDDVGEETVAICFAEKILGDLDQLSTV